MQDSHSGSRPSPLSPSQYSEIENLLLEMGEFQPRTIREELEWFVHGMGLNPHYFQRTPLPLIAHHVAALKASRILNRERGQAVDVQLVQEQPEHAMYVVREAHAAAVKIERRIERKYPGTRIQSFCTPGRGDGEELRLYFVTEQDFKGKKLPCHVTDIHRIAAHSFLDGAVPETIERYQRLLDKAPGSIGPAIEISAKRETNETRLMVAVPVASSPAFFTAVSDVLQSYGLHSNRKYREPFANGITVFTVYMDSVEDEHVLANLEDDLSLLYNVPLTTLTEFFQRGQLTAQAVTYAFAASAFSHQFLTGFGDEYLSIAAALKDRPELMGTLQSLRTRLVKNSFSEERIRLAVSRNVALVQKIYEHFLVRHASADNQLTGSSPDPVQLLAELRHEIRISIDNENDRRILSFFLDFNQLVLRTNFYKNEKVSLAFRLSGGFLERADYADDPYGLYFIVSPEFRAFHVRFRDVARGGIRLVRSATPQIYANNAESAFDENYNLAHTQQHKNKDIPEGGSKGVILLTPRAQKNANIAFRKYVHGLMDLMLPNEEVRNYLQRDEILFLGPDEGTAELMDVASEIARKRGYPFWKAFTTGRSRSKGGIPHDVYGMTTRGVHEYVLQSLEKLGLEESQVTKIQTGGPDGDLGSNEILISKDRTLAIIDGSGVLYDPEGIDRTELTHLAKERKMVSQFDRSRLSKDGFLVLVSDMSVTLPDGRFVANGTDFRNGFHLSDYAVADMFVPCGGRPRSIHINNWRKLLKADGTPKYKIIVEGANLFLTQAARLELEKQGVVLFKDASANKGGVTSSSLEVLAALSLDDGQYNDWMCEKDGGVPPFRQRYVSAIMDRICHNARLEFHRIWAENARSGQPRSVLTDLLSTKINQVADAIRPSALWDDDRLRRAVIGRCCPEALIDAIGLDAILKRVPDNYLRAMFASYVASRFVYRYGLTSNEVDFVNFIRDIAT